jgi:hypothetical protein
MDVGFLWLLLLVSLRFNKMVLGVYPGDERKELGSMP